MDINEIISFSSTNKAVYSLLRIELGKPTNSIVPFVGDQLSEFIFGTRETLIEELKTNLRDVDKANIRWDELRFLQSLKTIIDIWGGDKDAHPLVDKYLVNYYNNNFIDTFALEHQPIRLIPLIGTGDCITTNIDQMLECAYDLAGKRGLDDILGYMVATPSDREALARKINSSGMNKCLLFKMHGDLDKGDRLITTNDFDTAYNNGTQLIEELKKWMSQHILFFIGVDLFNEAYLLDFFKDYVFDGANHFALYGCDSPDETQIINSKLSKYNIIPFFYKKDCPESVEVILQKLLIDTNSIKYQRYAEGIYNYNFSFHKTIGRESEFNELFRFLNGKREGLFSWCYIYGEGIVGKSKLVNDFARNNCQGWDWYLVSGGRILEFIRKQQKRNDDDTARRIIHRNKLYIFDDIDIAPKNQNILAKVLSFLRSIMKLSNDISIKVIFVSDNNSNFMELTKELSAQDAKTYRKYAFSRLILADLTVDKIVAICREYINYCYLSLGFIEKDLKLFETIIDELSEYITSLMDKIKSLILIEAIDYSIWLLRRACNYTDSDYRSDNVYERLLKETWSLIRDEVDLLAEGNKKGNRLNSYNNIKIDTDKYNSKNTDAELEKVFNINIPDVFDGA